MTNGHTHLSFQAQVKDQQEYIELLSVHQDGNVRTTPTAKKVSRVMPCSHAPLEVSMLLSEGVQLLCTTYLVLHACMQC